ncbi:MAG: Extensin-like [Hyphomicrobiales bacterium]|nr:Extensin-like [Hyphomicrobiales bacterium]
MKRAFIHILAACSCAPALAAPPAYPPLPPPRPNFEKPVVEAPPQPPPRPPQLDAQPQAQQQQSQQQPQDAPPGVCAAIEDGRLIGVSLPPIPGEGGCGVASPVRINGVKLSSGAKLKLTPDAVLNCEMAAVVADFLDSEVARIEASGAGKIVEVMNAGSYECRGTNRVVGAKLSEHAVGNAIDLRSFKFADGRSLTIGADRTPTWVGVKGAACARFKTVLGPGSDVEHKDHLHLDMRMRKSTTICQWVLD